MLAGLMSIRLQWGDNKRSLYQNKQITQTTQIRLWKSNIIGVVWVICVQKQLSCDFSFIRLNSHEFLFLALQSFFDKKPEGLLDIYL